MPDFVFDPLLPLWIVITLGVLATLAAIITRVGGLKSLLPRLLATLALCGALLNPQTVESERDPLPDAVLLLTDRSDSATLGERQTQIDAIETALIEAVKNDPSLELTRADIPAGGDGTRLAETLVDQIGQLPRARLAGVIAVTDGIVHDLPTDAAALLPEGVPFNSLILNDPTLRDRRIRAVTAPRFGLVGEQAEFTVQVDDPGHDGQRALIEIRLNGEIKARFPAIIGDRVSLPLKIERRGVNTVELTVQPAEGELTTRNNVFVAEISGIRDRMRVLLVTGQPHQGGRAWRNLLKSDPAVELVQFTILTNPGVKNTRAGPNELSLIRFPTRRLFEEKLDEFDLIIFDQFTRRRAPGRRSGTTSPILPPFYIHNVAEYVERGGALLVATGPAFAGDNSLYRSPLAAVLPIRPNGKTADYAFRPEINDAGKRHPITAPFAGQQAESWGRWFRIIESDLITGNVLMEGPAGEPLLIVEKVGDGRVGVVMSDQAWLWARGFDGGGPYSEMFRRLAHWLLGEPDLDAEKLTARSEGEQLIVERRTLGDSAEAVTLKSPDGTSRTVTLDKIDDGVFRAVLPTSGQGAYRLEDSQVNTITAVGALNPREFADLVPTENLLKPLSEATGGFIGSVTAETLPNLTRPKAGSPLQSDQLNLVAHERFITRASRRTPLLPGLLFFALALLAMGFAWWREGR